MGKARKCFVSCPFGPPGSRVRKRSDDVFRLYIEQIAKEAGFEAFRSIEKGSPGEIFDFVIKNLCTADLVIADLTDSNPNVYYELAVRHATGKPFIVLVDDPKKLKFNVHGLNAIGIGSDGLEDSRKAEKDLRKQILEIKDGDGRMENSVFKGVAREVEAAKVSGAWKAFIWRIIYAKDLAADWLNLQEKEFIECARAFDRRGYVPDGQDLRDLLANYKAFKDFQGKSVQGMIFHRRKSPDLVDINGIGHLPLGTPPPIIEINGQELEDGAEVNFRQPSMQLEIKPGTGITGTIKEFYYSVRFGRRNPSLEGMLYHPDFRQSLQVGRTTLSPD